MNDPGIRFYLSLIADAATQPGAMDNLQYGLIAAAIILLLIALVASERQRP